MVLVNYINVRNSQEYNILQMKFFLWVLFVLSIEVIPSLVFGGYEEGSAAFERSDYEIALKEFKALAVQKDSRGQYALGLMYDLGTGVPLDFKEAIKWYLLSAEQGHAGAQNNLATMYAEGEGVAKDYKKAIKWYELSAQQGNFDAPNNLGAIYLKGIAVRRNYVKAYMWFHVGEMKGDRAAKKNRQFIEKKMVDEEVLEANKQVSEWMKRHIK